MSSSAFFIEAAANTVRLLSWAKAGDRADPHRITRAAKRMARRCIVALHAGSRAALSARAKPGVGEMWNATGGSAVPPVPRTYGPTGYRSKNNNRLGVIVKCPF